MSGYLDDEHHFTGRVHVRGVLYHVEPASRYNIQDPQFESVMYRGSKESLLHSQLVRTLEPPSSPPSHGNDMWDHVNTCKWAKTE